MSFPRWLMAWLVFLLAMAGAPSAQTLVPVPAPLTGTVTPSAWQAFDVNYPGITLACGKPFHFIVAPPPQYNPSLYKYPLYIWLHPDHSGDSWYLGGASALGQAGNEAGSYNTAAFQTRHPAFYVAPSADQTNGNGSTGSCTGSGDDAVLNWGGWFHTGSTPGSGTHYSGDTGPNTFAILAMINDLESRYSIDVNHIIINGFSLGGIYTDYACLHYNAYTGDKGRIFAACGGSAGVDEADAPPSSASIAAMRNVPQWMFSGTGDNQSNPNDWNTPLCTGLGGNPAALTGITSPSANQCGTSAMRYTLCPSCGHQDTDAGGNPVWANQTINDFLFSQAASVGPTTPTGTGTFQVTGGKIIAPNGTQFSAHGINIYWLPTTMAQLCPTSACSKLLSDFPGINFIRVVWENGYNQSGMEPYITWLTNLGIVVDICDFDISPGQPPASGGTLTSEIAWYSGLASTYKNNPYVWYETQNEMYGTGSVMSSNQQQTYNAVRAQTSTGIVFIGLPGGGNVGTIGVSGQVNGSGMTPSVYASMHNMVWDLHYYPYIVNKLVGNYSNDNATIQTILAGSIPGAYGIAATQSITSADGVVPVIVGEFGNSTDGLNFDSDGVAFVNATATYTGDAGYAVFAAGTVQAFNGPSCCNALTDGSNNLINPYGGQMAALIQASANSQPTQGEILGINAIPSVAVNTSFSVSGTISGVTAAPSLQYQDNGGSWQALPAGSSISATAFSFTNPGLPANGAAVVAVRDANNNAISAISAAFIVKGPESANNTVATPGTSTVTPTFSDTFTSLPLHNLWQSGDKWQLVAPDTTAGRGGPNFGENGDQWWVNPFNANTPIGGIYVQDSAGLHLGLLNTPSGQQAYINAQAGTNLPYVGALMNTSQTNYQKYGYWEYKVSVPKVPGFSFQADTENVQVTGMFPPEIDLRIATSAAGVQTVLFQFALGGGQYTQYTAPTSFDPSALHTYGWDWEADFITFYIDNVQAAQFANPSAAYRTNPMFLFLVTGANYIGTGDPSPGALPVSANVKAVNVYPSRLGTGSGPSPTITDANGNTFSITTGAQILVNGSVDTTTANVIELAYVNHILWQENAAGNWYSFVSNGVYNGPTTTSPLGGTSETLAVSPIGSQSANVAFSVSGTISGDTTAPSLQYQDNAGTWLALPSSTITATTFTFLHPALAGGQYTVSVRDAAAPTIIGSSNTFSVAQAGGEAIAVNPVSSQTANVGFTVTGTITGAPTSGGGGGSGNQGLTPPSLAATLGYNSLTFGPNFKLCNTDDPNTGVPAMGACGNIAPFSFFGTSWTEVGVVQNSDGSITLDGTGELFGNGATLGATGQFRNSPLSFAGQSFGGGFLAQVMMKGGTPTTNDGGPMSWWTNDVETMNGAGQGWGTTPWPGQQQNYTFASGSSATPGDGISIYAYAPWFNGGNVLQLPTFNVSGGSLAGVMTQAAAAINGNSAITGAGVTAVGSGTTLLINPATNGKAPAMRFSIVTVSGAFTESWNYTNYANDIETDIAEFDFTNDYAWALHNWHGTANDDVSAVWGGPLASCPGGGPNCAWIPPTINGVPIDFNQYHKYGMAWVPATSTTPGWVQYFIDDNPASNKLFYNLLDPNAGPPPVASSAINCVASPYGTDHNEQVCDVPANSAWSVIDTKHLMFIFGGATGSHVTFNNMQVWQKDGQSDIPVVQTGTVITTTPTLQYQDGSGAWLPMPAGAVVTGTTFTFLHPGMPATSSGTISVRDANNTGVVGVSNTFAVNASTAEALSVSAIPGQQANVTFNVQGSIVNASAPPSLQYQDNGGAWQALPAGSAVSSTAFSFIHPGVAASSSEVVAVRDAANTSVTASSNAFTVIRPESPSGIVVTSVGPTITDANGNTFSISTGGLITINGTNDPTTANVTVLAYVNHILWQENAAGNWYNYLGTPGSYGGPTTVSPLGPETLAVAGIGTQVAGIAFAVSGTIGNALSAPTLQYSVGSGPWIAFPTGSTISNSAFSLTIPGIATVGTTTVSVRDAVTNTIAATSGTFAVNSAAPEQLSFATIAGQQANAPFRVTGSIANATTIPTLQYNVNGGAFLPLPTGSPVSLVTQTSFAFTVPGQAAGATTIGIRDANATTITGTSNSFIISPAAAEMLTIAPIGNQVSGQGFGVNGTIANATSTPTLQYAVNGGTWLALPSGASVAITTYSFTVPGQSAGSTTISVRDAAQTTITVTSNSFQIGTVVGETLSVATVPTQFAGQPFSVGGSIANATTIPTLQYNVNGGTWLALPSGSLVSQTAFSIIVPGQAAGTTTIGVRDSAQPSITASSNSFQVTPQATETLSLGNVLGQLAGQTFTVSGSIGNALAIPTLQYRVNAGTYLPLPAGSVVTLTTFSIPIPPQSAGSATVSVRDANATTISSVSNTFQIAAAGNEALSINPIPVQQVGMPFSVSGTVVNLVTAPTLQYSDNGGAFQSLPAGASVTPTGFNFQHPGLGATQSMTVVVRDTNHPTIAASAPAFVVIARESPNLTTITTVGPQIVDSQGNTWTLTASKQVALNGVAQASTGNVIEIAYVNRQIWYENASLNWWVFSTIGTWTPTGGSALGPLPSSKANIYQTKTGALATVPNFTVAIPGIIVNDTVVAGQFSVMVTATDGTVSMPGASGSGTTAMAETGTLGAINQSLSGLQYTGKTIGNGVVSITVTDPAMSVAVSNVPIKVVRAAPVIQPGK